MANLIDILQQYKNIDVTIGHKDWVVYDEDAQNVVDPQPIASCGYNRQPDFSYNALMPAILDYTSRIRDGGVSKRITVTAL